MKQRYWWHLQKGTGIIVTIPGDEHDGVQSKRPGIVLKAHRDYIKVQLLSSQPSAHDLGQVVIRNKMQYIRPIYLKNIITMQILDLWYDYNREPIKINKKSSLMKLIESAPYKANAITLDLNDYLTIKDNNETLKSENLELKHSLKLEKSLKY